MIFCQLPPAETALFEKMTTNGIMGTLLIVIVWRLPTLLSLFMENRKEVAVIMEKQSNTFVDTLNNTIERSERKMSELIVSFENRFKKIEEGLDNVGRALTRMLEDNNERKSHT